MRILNTLLRIGIPASPIFAHFLWSSNSTISALVWKFSADFEYSSKFSGSGVVEPELKISKLSSKYQNTGYCCADFMRLLNITMYLEPHFPNLSPTSSTETVGFCTGSGSAFCTGFNLTFCFDATTPGFLRAPEGGLIPRFMTSRLKYHMK